jgi:hypothetical protein
MIDQQLLGFGTAGNRLGPCRHRAVPGQRMAAYIDTVLAREIHDRIRLLEAVFAAGRTQLQPFQFALRRDHLAIGDNRGAIGRIGYQRIGARGGAVWNEFGFRRPRCRKCGHAGQYAGCGNAQRRGLCRASQKITPGLHHDRPIRTSACYFTQQYGTIIAISGPAIRMELPNLRHG